MDFSSSRAIYLQIVDWVCAQIVSEHWPVGERVLSVRELGARLEVNPNTVMRSYEMLQNQQIIVNRRGVGFFVADEAVEKIKQMKKEQFVNEELPAMFANMEMLGVPLSEVEALYEEWKKKRE
ncbi:MAG: GntR family transcriptional regulator [Bacteroidales bacterium]|nr:GntR family transcriptional regulator [Bacteroidales bacterium]